MSKDKISDYSSTANSNTDIAAINIDEGCAPSGINNAIRALMAQLKNFQTGASGDTLTVGGVLTVTGGSASAPAITTSGDTNTGVLFPAADTVGITTNGTERVRIDSSGNLGHGITPSTWTSIDKAFEIGRAGNGIFSGGVDDLTINSNAYYNAGWKFGANGYANRFNVGSSNGQFQWFVSTASNASGSGAAASFTQAMTLDASGNLGLGVTSTTFKLHVAGTGYFTGDLRLKNSGSNTSFIRAEENSTSAAYTYATMDGRSTGYWAFSTNDTERARIDASGNVGIGTTSPTKRLQVESGSTATGGQAWSHSAGTVYARIGIVNPGTSNDTEFGTVSNNDLRLITNNTERARFDSSGNLLVGTTVLSNTERLNVTFPGSSKVGLSVDDTSATSCSVMIIRNNGTICGSISKTTTATAYNTSSDYRLKHDIAPMTGALNKVTALKPVTYKWNADNSDGQGFIAHELAEVCPDAVHGVKDAVETYIDAEGNEQTRPVYQGIDTSFLVATLTAAIQEQQAIITQLQADVAALKGQA